MSVKNPLLVSALCAAALVLMFPAFAAADDFDFSAEDAKKAKPKKDGKKDDGDDFSFAADEGTKVAKSKTRPIIAVMVIQTKAITKAQRDTLQGAFVKAMQYDRIKPKFKEIRGDKDLTAKLAAMGGADCLKEPLCLASVARKAGVQRVLTVRVDDQADKTFRLEVDHFDVDDKRYIKNEILSDGLKTFPDIEARVDFITRKVFDIRERFKGPKTVDDGNAELVKNIFAYTTAGLAVACVGGGVAFGLQAKGLEDEVKNAQKSGAAYANLTQVEAQKKLRDAEGKARSANVFYGLGVAMAATSVLLFTMELGDETAEEASNKLKLAPAITPTAVGFGASMRF